MAGVLTLLGRTLFSVLLGLILGYGIMVLMITRSMPEAVTNEKFLRYREIFMVVFIAVFFLAAFLMMFT